MDALCLVATPYVADTLVTYDGPPVPFGAAAFGGELSYQAYGGEVAVYASDIGYTSRPSDSPANVHFEARLLGSLAIDAAAFDGDEPTGRSRIGTGVLAAANGDGALDAWATYAWDARSVRLYEVDRGSAFSASSLIFAGTADGLSWDERSIVIRLRDQQLVFDRAIQNAVYGGTGGADGGSAVEGLRKPLAFGKCRNIPLLLIDPVNLVYQAHDGQIESVLAVRDRGATLTVDTDYASYAALVGATIAAGEYGTCLAEGLVRLGGAPDGQVTADVEGDARGGTYVSSTGTIIRRIATTRMSSANLADPAGLDTASFSALEAAQSAVVGYFVPGDQDKKVAEVFDDLMAAAGGYWGVTRTGELFVKRLEAPSSPALTVTDGEIVGERALARRGLRPSRRQTVEYQRLWAVQPADGLVDSLTAADRAFYSTEARVATVEGAGVITAHRLARDVRVRAFFDSQAAAEAEATRRQALFGTRRDIYEVSVPSGLAVDGSGNRLWLGDEASVDVSRFDLSGGKNLVIIGISEGGAATTLALWG